MNQSPTFSVIIPTYNRSDLVLRAVNSVFSQKFQDFEIIVIDDGSTDDTENAILKNTDARLRYIKTENQGVQKARNLGIKESKGIYIAFLDSDDEFLPEKLEVCKNEFENKSINFIVNNRLTKKEKKEFFSSIQSGEIHVSDFLKGRYPFSSSMIVYKKSDFPNLKFDERLQSVQDFDFILRALNIEVCYFLGEPLTVIHKSVKYERISTSYKKKIAGFETIYEKAINKEYNLDQEDILYLKMRMIYNVAKYSIIDGQRYLARDYARLFFLQKNKTFGRSIIVLVIFLLSYIYKIERILQPIVGFFARFTNYK